MKAVIDLGTNTFHLLIADIKGTQIIEHFKLQIPVNLGEEGINKSLIAPAAMERGLEALAQFHTHLLGFKPSEILAFATSAIRNAANGAEFIERARRRFGIAIKAISGDEEATYIYHGVKQSFTFPEEPVLVMDIGGGSVEFILGMKDEIKWKGSFETGAARLIDKFHRQDPIGKHELMTLHTYLHEQVRPLREVVSQNRVNYLVGSAGSFETLTQVLLQDLGKKPKPLQGNAFEICKKDVDAFYELLVHSTKEQRSLLKGMEEFRVEMIVVAAVFMKYIMDEFQIAHIVASNYSMKEGILLS